MENENLSPILLLPNEILTKILINIPNLKNIEYMTVNKRFFNTIQSLFDHYETLYNSIDPNWEKDIRKLLNELFSSKNEEAIMFLYNNYNSEKVIYNVIFYIGLFNYTRLLRYVNKTNSYALANGAAEGGHLDIVKYAVELGAKNFNEIAIRAAKGGYLNIVKYIIEMGANDNAEIVSAAVEGGHLHIVKYFVDEKHYNDFIRIAVFAALNGHLNIVQYAVQHGANDYERIAVFAALGGHLDIVKYAVARGVRNYEHIAMFAAKGGHLHIVEYAVERGARNYG